jgi:hypothetical protein
MSPPVTCSNTDMLKIQTVEVMLVCSIDIFNHITADVKGIWNSLGYDYGTGRTTEQ